MSKKHYTATPGKTKRKSERTPSTISGASYSRQQSPHGFIGGWRTLWLALIVVLPGIVILFALTTNGIIQRNQTSAVPPATSSTIHSPASVQAASIHMYKVSPSDAGLMLPVVDQHGNVWFGEMASNHLARLDTHTGTVTTWTPPHGEEGIMGITIDARGNIWFVEQNANYIGRFDPARQAFRVFSFGSNKSQRVGLEDLQFDTSGKLWFTETVAGRIGNLDPASGKIETWALPAAPAGTQFYVFGLAITPNGQVWFGTFSGGVVGHLDPTTGHMQLYHLGNPGEQIYSMAADTQGRVWFTDLQFGKLGMIDTSSGKITELQVPSTLGNPEDLHSIVVANGAIWFTSSGANALIRYSPDDGSYTFFQLPAPNSIPFGLALASTNTLWFTAGGNPINYIGEMTIPA